MVRIKPPAVLFEPGQKPEPPPLLKPIDGLVMEDVDLWYNEFLSRWEKAWMLSEEDKAAARWWLNQTE